MMPTVDAVPVVHAHWNCIENVFSYEGTFGGYECSHCHKMFLDDMCENNGSEMVDAREDFKFCPFCGAKMDEKVEDKTDEKE
jgi:NAD-dependent SIR2 family protein deacetylase